MTFTSQYFFFLFETIFFFSDPQQNQEILNCNEIKIEETGCDSEEQEEELLEDLNHMQEDEEEVLYEEDSIIEELNTEQESDDRDMYTCNLCQVNFYSIEDHIAQYHKDQQVIVEVSSLFFFFIFNCYLFCPVFRSKKLVKHLMKNQ